MNAIGVFIFKVVRRCLSVYEHAAEAESRMRFKTFGFNSRIEYPFIISNNEKINIGNHVTIMPNVRMQIYSELTGLDSEITIGDGSFIGLRNSFLAGGGITLGKQVLIASDVLITSENHGMDATSDIPYMDQKLTCSDVNIGDGTWIGQGVMILPGVSIGKKCIIGAGSVVTRSIPDYSIAVGNPARVIKCFNFDSKQWENLEEKATRNEGTSRYEKSSVDLSCNR